MAISSSFGFALLALVLVVVHVRSASGTPNTNFVSSACNTQKIPRGNPFFNNLGALLADLKQNTAFSGYDYKASRAGSGGAPTAWGICSNAIGARVQLTDCFIRYEQYSF